MHASHPPYVKAVAIAVGPIILLAAGDRNHQVRYDLHCHGRHACIVKVARTDCTDNPSDRHHCRIAWRAAHPVLVHQLAPTSSTSSSTTTSTPASSTPSSTTAPASSSSSSFDQCVAFRESSGNANATSGAYYGLYQFDAATWAQATAAMGVNWPWIGATPAEQTAAFEFWSSRDPGAWPNTVPMCGGE